MWHAFVLFPVWRLYVISGLPASMVNNEIKFAVWNQANCLVCAYTTTWLVETNMCLVCNDGYIIVTVHLALDSISASLKTCYKVCIKPKNSLDSFYYIVIMTVHSRLTAAGGQRKYSFLEKHVPTD